MLIIINKYNNKNININILTLHITEFKKIKSNINIIIENKVKNMKKKKLYWKSIKWTTNKKFSKNKIIKIKFLILNGLCR